MLLSVVTMSTQPLLASKGPELAHAEPVSAKREHSPGRAVLEVGKKSAKRVVGVFSDFADFINNGNIIDLAVGLIVGAAFSGIVSSLVADIIGMHSRICGALGSLGPFISLATSAVSLADLHVVLRKSPNDTATHYATIAAAKAAGAVTFNYGNFLQVYGTVR